MTHTPVLLKEMLSLLSPQSNRVYLDATFGAGGYSREILASADCKVYAIDRDETVTKFYDDLSAQYPDKIKLFIEKFSNIKSILSSVEPPSVIPEPSPVIPVLDTGIQKKNNWIPDSWDNVTKNNIEFKSIIPRKSLNPKACST